MTARFKIPVLAVLALAAMSAFASAAFATPPEFHVEKAPATLKGEQTNVHTLTLDGGTVKCKKATFHGTQNVLTTTTMTLTPNYAECVAFGLAATIDVNECAFLLHLVANSNPPTALADIECPTGKEITVTVPAINCTIHIEPQVGLKHVVFDNQGAGAARDILATFTLEGIRYVETPGCLGPGINITTANGTYTGAATIRAFEDPLMALQYGLWVE